MWLDRLKKYGWWGLVFAHVVTPFIPLAFPVRVGMTAYMATQHGFCKVVLIANTVSALSLMAQYLIYQYLGSAHWLATIEHDQLIGPIIGTLDAHMFLTLIGLNISPFPETLWPLIASARDYPIWKFGLAMWLGRLTHTIPMALGGIGLQWLWQQIQKRGLRT